VRWGVNKCISPGSEAEALHSTHHCSNKRRRGPFEWSKLFKWAKDASESHPLPLSCPEELCGVRELKRQWEPRSVSPEVPHLYFTTVSKINNNKTLTSLQNDSPGWSRHYCVWRWKHRVCCCWKVSSPDLLPGPVDNNFRLANLDHKLQVLLIEGGESNLNNPWVFRPGICKLILREWQADHWLPRPKEHETWQQNCFLLLLPPFRMARWSKSNCALCSYSWRWILH